MPRTEPRRGPNRYARPCTGGRNAPDVACLCLWPIAFCPSVVDAMPHPPPFSPSLIAMEISGDLDGYTYYVNKNRKVVCYPAAPALRPPTPRQQVERARFALAMRAWKLLPSSEQQVYNQACDDMSLCMWGANLYSLIALTDTGGLRKTIESQVGYALAVPPQLTPPGILLPGTIQNELLAWIAQKYPP